MRNVIGITGILGLIFMVLKLCGVIKWSWLKTLSPFWIGLLLYAVVFSLNNQEKSSSAGNKYKLKV